MASTRKAKDTALSSALVAVTGDGADDDAVRLACEMLASQKAQLYLVYVIEVERGLPVDAEIGAATSRAEEVLNHVEEVARPYKFDTQAELLQSRRAGHALVQEAVEKGVDAIILGLPYRYTYGSFSMGDTAPYVLKNAPCKVILWRDPIPQPISTNGHQHVPTPTGR